MLDRVCQNWTKWMDHLMSSRGIYVMKKGGGSESTIIIGPSKSVLVYTLHSLEYVLGFVRFRVFVLNYIYISPYERNAIMRSISMFRLQRGNG